MAISPFHSVVGGAMQLLRMQYLLIALAIAFLLFWDPLDRWLRWQSQTVEVTAVKELCTAFDENKWAPVDQGDCAVVHAKFDGKIGVKVSKQKFLYFTYTSPADDKAHAATLVDTRDPATLPVKAGDVISILVSRSNTTLVKLP